MVIMRVEKKTSTWTFHLDQLPVLRGGVLELNPWLEEAGERRVGEGEGGGGRHHRHRWVRRVSHSLEMMFDSSVYQLAHRFTPTYPTFSHTPYIHIARSPNGGKANITWWCAFYPSIQTWHLIWSPVYERWRCTHCWLNAAHFRTSVWPQFSANLIKLRLETPI